MLVRMVSASGVTVYVSEDTADRVSRSGEFRRVSTDPVDLTPPARKTRVRKSGGGS